MNEKETRPAPMVDIIVPHYTEPWGVGEKFFSMLDLQRGINFSSLRVTVVNDGEENALPDEHFQNRPYQVRQISIPHAGVSAARNAGIKAADAEWVMFCDFDDMFNTVFSLRNIINILPTDGYDILWTDFFAEVRFKDGGFKVYRHGLEQVNIHAKLYRKIFLEKNDIFFDEKLRLCEDYAFNTIAFSVADQKRIGKINTETPIYLWCDVEGSVTNGMLPKRQADYEMYRANRRVCEIFYERKMLAEYKALAQKMMFDAYDTFLDGSMGEEYEKDFRDFCLGNRQAIRLNGRNAIERILKDRNKAKIQVIASKEVDRFTGLGSGAQGSYDSFMDWIKSMERR